MRVGWVAAGVLLGGVGPAWAEIPQVFDPGSGGRTGDGDCLNPVGTSLNELLDYDETIIWAHDDDGDGLFDEDEPDGLDNDGDGAVDEELVFCPDLPAGSWWTPRTEWVVAEAFPPGHSYSIDGFTRVGDTPIEDFYAKWVQVTYVIDMGTEHEDVISYTAEEVRSETLSVPPFLFGVPARVWFALANLHPLPEGDHTVDAFVHMSDMHCDGLGEDPAENCLLPGANPFPRHGFTVVP